MSVQKLPQCTKISCQRKKAASAHKYKLSVHKSCLSAQCTKINFQCTKVALKEAWLHVGRGRITRFSRAFLLLNCTVGTSCRCHLPCKSMHHQGDILIPHRKACFVLAVVLKYLKSVHDADYSSREENVGRKNLPQACFQSSIKKGQI